MADAIGVDIDVAQRRVTQLIDGCDAVRGYEFGFADEPMPALAVTAVFDRAVHAFAWTTVQVVTGTSTELIDDADALAAVVRSLGELDSEIATRLDTVRGELDVAGS